MIAKGKIQNIDVTVGAQNFSFIGGAVGIASGEIFIQAVDHAIKNNSIKAIAELIVISA